MQRILDGNGGEGGDFFSLLGTWTNQNLALCELGSDTLTHTEQYLIHGHYNEVDEDICEVRCYSV